MTYNEWRDELKSNLLSVPESERRRVLDYYAEAYADRREAGFSEREIIEYFGAPYDAARRILSDNKVNDYEETPKTQDNRIPDNRNEAVYSPAPPPPPVAAEAAPKRKTGLIIGITAAVLVVLALLIFFVAVLALNGWSFKAPKFEMRTYTASADYSDIDVSIGTGSVRTEYYDGDKIIIEYPAADGYNSGVAERQNKLVYSARRKSLISFGNWNIPEATVKLPARLYNFEFDVDAGSVTLGDGEYGRLEIEIDAGNFKAGNVSCTSLNLDIDAGNFKADAITCNVLELDMSAGNASVTRLTSTRLDVDVSAGSLSIGLTGAKEEYTISTEVSAGSCNVSNQTGNTNKRIDIEVSAGKVGLLFGV